MILKGVYKNKGTILQPSETQTFHIFIHVLRHKRLKVDKLKFYTQNKTKKQKKIFLRIEKRFIIKVGHAKTIGNGITQIAYTTKWTATLLLGKKN